MSPSTLRLLAVVGILLVIQWIVLPLLSWQGDKVAEIERQISRLLERSQVVASEPAVQNDLDTMRKALTELSTLSSPKNDGIELPLQQLLSATLADFSIEIESFEWGEIPDGDVVPLKARISVTGRTQDFIDWHNSLLESQNWISVEELNFRRLRQNSHEMATFTGDIVVRVILGGEL
jgi:hypothetical protein